MDIAAITSLCKLLFDGLAIVVIILLYIKTNNNRQKDYEEDRKEYKKLNDELQSNYHSMIKDIVQGVSGKHLTPEESKHIARIDKSINESINKILKESNASRVCIVKYHNGNKDMTGRSFLKMSMTDEVVNVGVAPMMTEFKDVFRSLLAYWCHELDENGECTIKNTEEMKNVDITMYQYLKTRNIESKYGVALRDLDNNVIGFMCVEYLSKNDFNNKKLQEIIKQYLPTIQTLIAIEGGVKNELQ